MERIEFKKKLSEAFRVHNIVALLGPRQCGKTTLARGYFSANGNSMPEQYFDLEDPVDEARLDNPRLALQGLTGLVVIDEVQRKPDLFKILRVLTDSKKDSTRYLILGSASKDLIQQSSESLAGRIQYLELTPFQLREVGHEQLENLWLRGGFPPAFLANSNDHGETWRDAYIRTYLEQDIPNLGLKIESAQLRRFWMMLTHYHGQMFNASEISRSLNISDVTAKRYLDILCGTFMVRQLQPWYENIKKRQVKTPKIYFRDSGIYHRLLLMGADKMIHTHPKLGASWEGFALEETIRVLDVATENIYFWAIHQQCELDLFVVKDGRRLGFEFKYSDAPKKTKSMQQAVDSLNLDALTVVYPGNKAYQIDSKIFVRPL